MSITASQVKELRELSGVGMMECKKALVETNGDLEKALDLLRANSSLKAEKKASRVAADGEVKIAENSKYTSLVEINSETDFAAKDSQFKDFASDVAEHLANNQINDINDLSSIFEEKRQSLIQSIGENIQLRRVSTIDVDSNMKVGLYIHSDSKLGSIVAIEGGSDDMAKDIAMHVAAFNPICLSEDKIDKEVLDREKAIYENQAQESGKPKEIMEKMVEGKVKRFLGEVSLLSQGFVKDPEITIQDYIGSENANIISFTRLKVGEGIEVETKDFADEVAEQLK